MIIAFILANAAASMPVANAAPQTNRTARATVRPSQRGWRRLTFMTPDGGIRVTVPPGFRVSTEHYSNMFVNDGGWRFIPSAHWRLDTPATSREPGFVVVNLRRSARSRSAADSTWLTVQIGVSRSPDAVRACTTFSTQPVLYPAHDHLLGPQWTVTDASDAGMSQSYVTTDYRRVIGDACWAVSRIKNTAGVEDHDRALPSVGQVNRETEAVLKSLQFLQPSGERAVPTVG